MSISLIFDIAIAAILLLSLIIGGSRGFVRSLLSVVILVAAACAVLMIADGASARAVPFALSLVISLAVFVGSWALSVKWFRAREL